MIVPTYTEEFDRIKVLHIITHLGVGGALDNTLLTVERLPRERYQVDLAAGVLSPEEGYTSWEGRSRRCADNLFLFPDLQRQVHPRRDLRACNRLAAFIRDEGYHIVHTHCAKAGVLGRIAARRAGVPVVVHTCHAFGNQVARFEGGALFRKATALGKEWAFTALEQYAGKLSDHIITVCDQNKHRAIDMKLAPPHRITTIYSGIDLDRFDVGVDRSEICDLLEIDPERPVVAFVGRLAEQKAPMDFVAAAKRVLALRPDTQFLIAGDGPLADQVIAAIRDEPQIRCIGFYDHIPELLSVLDVLAVSSHWEGLGRSVTEAMIMGVPVAATAVDGIPELVVDGETGLLSPPRKPDALAINILTLIAYPEEAKRMARSARSRVVPAFGAHHMLEQIDGLYRTLLHEKGVQPSPEFEFTPAGMK